MLKTQRFTTFPYAFPASAVLGNHPKPYVLQGFGRCAGVLKTQRFAPVSYAVPASAVLGNPKKPYVSHGFGPCSRILKTQRFTTFSYVSPASAVLRNPPKTLRFIGIWAVFEGARNIRIYNVFCAFPAPEMLGKPYKTWPGPPTRASALGLN